MKTIKEYIIYKIKEIEHLTPSEKDKVCDILQDVWNKYYLINLNEDEPNLRKGSFQAGKEIRRENVLNDINQLKKGNTDFISNNFFQIKLTLKSLLNSLG